MNDYHPRELIGRLKGHASFPYLLAVLRGVLSYLTMFLMLSVWHFLFLDAFGKNTLEYLDGLEFVIYLTSGVLFFLILNTVLLTYAIFARRERLAFLTGDRIAAAFDADAYRRELLRDRVFWLEVGVLILLGLLFPMTGCGQGSVLYFLESFPPIRIESVFLRGLLIRLPYAVGVILLAVFARVEARKFWLKKRSSLFQTQLWRSVERKSKRAYSYPRMILRLIGYLILYVFGTLALSVVIPTAGTVFAVILLLLMQPWFVFLILAFSVLVVFLALRKRIKFIRALKKTCRENGFTLFELKRPYRSIFRDNGKYTFGVEANGKIYYCRLLASVRRSNKFYLDEKGICTRAWALHIPQPRMAARRGYVQTYDRGTGDDREFFRITSEVDYTFEIPTEGVKIVLLNPVPRRAFRVVDEHFYEMDNGDRIGEYQVYTGNAFLRLLIRDRAALEQRQLDQEWIRQRKQQRLNEINQEKNK